MHNDLLEKKIEGRKEELKELEAFKSLIADKEKELCETTKGLPLSEYSTTQLKAELRRRKRER